MVIVLVLATGCGGSTARSSIGAPPSTKVKADPSPSGVAPGLLSSQSATLDSLRAQDQRQPVSVLISGIGARAPVQPRTTDPVSGGLDLPKDAAHVAWWASGTSPGDPVGTVVLAAHVVYNGQSGPFTHLDRLRRGALIDVRSANGVTYSYRVSGIRSAPKASLDRSALFNVTGPAALALVTCGGEYDPTTRSFANNLVVTANPVS